MCYLGQHDCKIVWFVWNIYRALSLRLDLEAVMLLPGPQHLRYDDNDDFYSLVALMIVVEQSLLTFVGKHFTDLIFEVHNF